MPIEASAYAIDGTMSASSAAAAVRDERIFASSFIGECCVEFPCGWGRKFSADCVDSSHPRQPFSLVFLAALQYRRLALASLRAHCDECSQSLLKRLRVRLEVALRYRDLGLGNLN